MQLHSELWRTLKTLEIPLHIPTAPLRAVRSERRLLETYIPPLQEQICRLCQLFCLLHGRNTGLFVVRRTRHCQDYRHSTGESEGVYTNGRNQMFRKGYRCSFAFNSLKCNCIDHGYLIEMYVACSSRGLSP